MKFWQRLSLRQKTMFTIILIVTVISIVSIILFSRVTHDIIRSEYSTYCSDLASSVANSVDVSAVKTLRNEVLGIYRGLDPSELIDSDHDDDPGYYHYLSNYSHIQKTKEFTAVRNSLRKIQDVSHVECLYIIWPDIESGRLIYLVDAAYEDNWKPGTLEPLYASDFKIDGDIRSGFDILLGESGDGGRIVTAAMPVCDSYGQVVAYAGLDYSIDEILAEQRRSILVVLLILAALAAAAANASISLVGKFIVEPINALSEASVKHYNDDSAAEGFQRFADLDIHTGDEIETLANSITRMEHDMNDYIENLLSTRNELDHTKVYAEEMEKNAFMDSLTAVRNKRAYDAAIAGLRADIEMGVADFGIAVADLNDLKHINDDYGHDRGDEAIRKICGILCDVFAHSPIYRFGGDEFVVILKNRDLSNIDELIASFREKTAAARCDASARPWERVSAAIGYAIYDPDKDTDVIEVFERADMAMYEDKKRIKKSQHTS